MVGETASEIYNAERDPTEADYQRWFDASRTKIEGLAHQVEEFNFFSGKDGLTFYMESETLSSELIMRAFWGQINSVECGVLNTLSKVEGHWRISYVYYCADPAKANLVEICSDGQMKMNF